MMVVASRVAAILVKIMAGSILSLIAAARGNHDGRRMVRFRNGDALSADDRAVQVRSAFAVSTMPGRAIPPSTTIRFGRARSARTRTASRRFRFSRSRCCWRNFALRPQHLIDELAVLFLIVRIAYVLTYLGDRPTLRSILWSIGFAINVAIFFMPLISGYLPI